MDRVKCEECNGTGKVRDDAGPYPCPACDNSGLRPLSFSDLRESYYTTGFTFEEWMLRRFGVEVKYGQVG